MKSVKNWATYTILKLNIPNLASQILSIFEQSIFQIFAKYRNDLHSMCSLLLKQISTKFKANWSIIT